MNRPYLHRQPDPRIVDIDEIERRLRDDRHSLDEEGEHVWNELRAHERLHGPARHVRIGEPITASRLVGAFALALVAFAAIYFGGHFIVAAL